MATPQRDAKVAKILAHPMVLRLVQDGHQKPVMNGVRESPVRRSITPVKAIDFWSFFSGAPFHSMNVFGGIFL